MALESGGFQPHKDYRGFVPAQQFYAALIAKGFAPVAARGILGNAMHESGGGSRGVYLDPPTDAGHPNWGTGDAAVGAIQWEGKRQAGVSPTLQSQVDKIWDEFNNPGSAGMPQGSFERLQSAQSPGEAAHFVNTTYERPQNPTLSDAQRQRFANVPLNATPGTTLTSVPDGIVHPPHSLTPPTAGAPYTPEAVAAANPAVAAASPAPADTGNALQKLLTKPPPTKDAQGNEVEGKSPLQKIAGAVGDVAQKEAPAAPTPQPIMPAQDPDPGLAPASSQLFQTVQQAAMRPLTWSSRPYGWNAGQQFGTTLNATGYGSNG
jgi:hypothetical protein